MAEYDPSLPTEISAELSSISRRRRIAEQMAAQGLAPMQRQAAPYSWTQVAAQLANAYLGSKGMKQADQQSADMAQRYQKGMDADIQRIAQIRAGQPGAPDSGMGFEEVQKPDPRAAIQAALLSNYPQVRKMGELEHKTFENEQTRANDRVARMEEKEMTLRALSERSDLDREARERMAQEANDLKLLVAQLRQEMSGMQQRSPAFTFFPTTEGYAAGNQRTGTAELVNVGGNRLVRPTDSPKVQGDIAAARTTGKATAERTFNMEGIGSVIKQAEDILSGKVKPTGSGVGSLVDKVAGFVGMNPRGAKEAQTLKAVAGALTAKMPRMEGPQSDRDTTLYREMAAEVGNDTVPVERRIAALQAVKNLWLKYERLNPEAFAPGAAPEGVPPELWNVMTPEERANWQR